MSVTEQQLAELELLSQSQLKLNQLTSRITTILSGFDGRLRSLESNIIPLHRTTQRLIRASQNIDRTFEALEKTETQKASIADLEPAVRQGPSAHDVDAYFGLMDEVKLAMTYVESSGTGGKKKISELMQIGASRLADLLQGWVEAESEPIDAVEHLQRGMPLPAFSDVLLQAIIPILNYLSGLRTDGTYLIGALNAYIGVRANFLVTSLQPLHTFSLEYVSARATGAGLEELLENGYLRGMAGFESLFASTYELGNNELQKATQLISSLNPLPSAEVSQTTIGIVSPPLSQLVSTSTNVGNSLARAMGSSHTTKNLATLSFHAGMVFDFVGTLSQYLPLVEKAFTTGDTTNAYLPQKGKTDGSLRELRTIEKTQQRQLCTACFRSIIDTLQNAPAKYGEAEGTVSTTVHDISYDGLRIMLQVWENRRYVSGPVLQMIGNGNWMKPEGSVGPQLAVNIPSGGPDREAEEQQELVIMYMNDVLATMLSALEQRGKSIRQSSTASIFLLNNVGFLKRELSSHPAIERDTEGGSTRFMVDVLGQDCDDLLAGTLRMASKGYLDAWGPCVSALMEDVPLSASAHHSSSSKANKLASAMGAGSDKAIIKDRLATFYEAFDEMGQLLKAFPLSQEDVEIKAKLLRDVSRMVCPLYNRFVAKHRQSSFSKDPSKYIRLSEKEVAMRIEDMFR